MYHCYSTLFYSRYIDNFPVRTYFLLLTTIDANDELSHSLEMIPHNIGYKWEQLSYCYTVKLLETTDLLELLDLPDFATQDFPLPL